MIDCNPEPWEAFGWDGLHWDTCTDALTPRLVLHPEFQEDLLKACGNPAQDAVSASVSTRRRISGLCLHVTCWVQEGAREPTRAMSSRLWNGDHGSNAPRHQVHGGAGHFELGKLSG